MRFRGVVAALAVVLLSGCMYVPFDGPDGLITNEYAHHNPGAPDAVRSNKWDVTSGSLFRRDEMGWTGVPDDRDPDATSSSGTNSAVFRLVTDNTFTDVDVRFDLIHHGFVATDTTPAVAWDGVHVFVRYQSEAHLYYASVNRRDGQIAIKKKVPGGPNPSNGGTYYEVASGTRSFTPGDVQRIRVTATNNPDSSVTIRIHNADGTVALEGVDRGLGGPSIRAAGRVGIRGDNSEFSFDNFLAKKAGAVPRSADELRAPSASREARCSGQPHPTDRS